MNKILCDDLWPTIMQLAAKARSRQAAVAYVTSEEYIKFKKGDVLITDASDNSIASGQTDAKLLADAFSRGAELYCLPGLHAKIYLIDRFVVIGSANISNSSANNLIEAAVVTDTPSTVGNTVSLLQQLKDMATRIDKKFIDRTLKIEVKRIFFKLHESARRSKISLGTSTTWLVGLFPNKKELPNTKDRDKAVKTATSRKVNENSELECFTMPGRSNLRKTAKHGDLVIQFWSESLNDLPYAVYKHLPILDRFEHDDCTEFFYEDYADSEKTSISWAKFQKLLKRANVVSHVGGRSAKSITESQSNILNEIWDS